MSKEAGKAIGIGILTFGLGSLIGVAGGAFARIGGFIQNLGTLQILGGASLALQRAPRRHQFYTVSGNQFGAAQTLPLAFGRVRAGGPMIWLGTSGASGEYLHYAVPVSAAHPGGVGNLIAVYLDGRKIPAASIDGNGDVTSGDFSGLVNLRWYRGTSTQAADTTLDNAFALWASTAYGRGVAYIAIRFFYDKANDAAFQKAFPGARPPVVEVAFEGQKVYDPRKDSTNGGSGSHRYADPTTWEYSANPALCDATYRIMARSDAGWGLLPASHIHWPTLAASADDCDATIQVPNGSGGSTTIARYAVSALLDTQRTKRQNSDLILSAMAGKAVTAGSKVKIYAGAYEAPATTIDATWLAAGGLVRRPKLDVNRVFNAYKVIYRRADDDYKERPCEPKTSATYESQDGTQRLWQELAIPTDDEYRAQYLAKVHRDLTREQGTLVVECNAKALDLESWETVTVNIDLGARTYTGTYLVADWEWGGGFGTLTLQQISATPYNSVLGDFVEKNATGTPTTTEETPPTPTGVTATGLLDAIELHWDALALSQLPWVEIHRSDTSGGALTKIDEVPATSTTFIDALGSAATKYYKLRVRDRRGNLGAFTSEVSATSTHAADGATVGADWSSNLSNRPTELTDGRVPTALNPSGQLQSGTTAGATIDGTAASTVRQRATDGWNLTQAGSGVRTGDPRNHVASAVTNRLSFQSTVTPTTAGRDFIDPTYDYWVQVNAHDMYVGGNTFAIAQQQVFGLNPATDYYIFTDVANYNFSGYTASVTTSAAAVLTGSKDRTYFGKSKTPNTGGGGGGGIGGGGTTEPP